MKKTEKRNTSGLTHLKDEPPMLLKKLQEGEREIELRGERDHPSKKLR